MLSKLVAHHRNGRPFHLWGTRVKVADETSVIIQFWIRSKRKRNLILIMSSESKRNRQLRLDGWVCECPFVGPLMRFWAKACTEAIWYSNPFWFYWCGALFYERKNNHMLKSLSPQSQFETLEVFYNCENFLNFSQVLN